MPGTARVGCPWHNGFVDVSPCPWPPGRHAQTCHVVAMGGWVLFWVGVWEAGSLSSRRARPSLRPTHPRANPRTSIGAWCLPSCISPDPLCALPHRTIGRQRRRLLQDEEEAADEMQEPEPEPEQGPVKAAGVMKRSPSGPEPGLSGRRISRSSRRTSEDSAPATGAASEQGGRQEVR